MIDGKQYVCVDCQEEFTGLSLGRKPLRCGTCRPLRLQLKQKEAVARFRAKRQGVVQQ